MKKIFKQKWTIFYQKISEIAPACLMMMVQGDITAITLGHFIKAFTTGGAAALSVVALSFVSSNSKIYDNKYLLAGLTAFVTMIVDLFVHPSHFNGNSTEAIATGLAAGCLGLLMSNIWKNKK